MSSAQLKTLLCLLLISLVCHARRCSIVNKKYVPSDVEAHHLAHNQDWDIDYCAALSRSNHSDLLRQVAAYRQHEMVDDSVMSHFEFTVDCGRVRRVRKSYIEPLFGILRHPLALACPDLKPANGLLSIDYLATARNDTPAVHLAPSKIYIDIGASTWNDLSQRGMTGLYAQHRIHFDRHLLWEAVPKTGPEIMKDVPATEYHNFQYFNVPAEVAADDPRNPLNVLLEIARIQDFVVFKLDIDAFVLEMALIKQIIARPEVHSRIDELYWEPHFNSKPLINCCWGKTADINLSLNETLHTLLTLRQLGIRAHGWP
jgi:hypothetical protein